uniref:Uncharacterized protein n=1 Tax=Panagrolaimus sp. JU765 TaxID=591449 RepID=A0AC34R7I5_9BILA
MDENKMLRLKIKKGTSENSPTAKISRDEFKGDRPRIVFGKDYCFVNVYKNGLLWRVRDINGNENIPFYLSFDEEIYVGDAALEHPKYLMPKVDLEMLFNKFIPNTTDVMENRLLSNENGEQFIVIKTFDGWKKTTPAMIVAIFIKSILKIIEQKLQLTIEDIHNETLFRCVQTNEVFTELISIVFDILKFEHISYNTPYLG